MKKTTKRLAAVVLAVMLLVALGGQALAAGTEADTSTGIMKPMWVNIDGINVTLTFNGTQANCSARVYGKVGTTKITGTAVLARLQNGVYTTVNTWSNLVANSDTLLFEGTYYVTSGYTYRLAFTTTVYKSGSSETVTAYSSASC